MSTTEVSIRIAKKNAACQAVLDHVRDGMVIGIGSGSTIKFAVESIAQLVLSKGLKVKCVPTSFQSRQLIIDNNLTLSALDQTPSIDLTIDGADEVDVNLNLIKGGGGCFTQEKVIAAQSKKLVIVADWNKCSTTLGEKWKAGIPIEVLPFAYVAVSESLKKLGGISKLREAKSKVGPVITDNGGFILDVDFGLVNEPAALEQELRKIIGIIETGLFINMSHQVYFGLQNGTTQCLEDKVVDKMA